VRRLDIAAEIIEVTRRERLIVELHRSLDPVGRYLEDALASLAPPSSPSSAAVHVVSGLCRLALEATCMEWCGAGGCPAARLTPPSNGP
jgi:hypothetical protein